jgi:reactive intermediate/imine deaminase
MPATTSSAEMFGQDRRLRELATLGGKKEVPDMTRKVIETPDAPKAIGPYSQAIEAGGTVYLSGQIGLDPATGQMVEGTEAQAHRVLQNLRAVARAAGGDLDAIVKITLLLADMADFVQVNEIMTQYFRPPYPARATYQVAALPKGGRVEVEGVMVLRAPGG